MLSMIRSDAAAHALTALCRSGHSNSSCFRSLLHVTARQLPHTISVCMPATTCTTTTHSNLNTHQLRVRDPRCCIACHCSSFNIPEAETKVKSMMSWRAKHRYGLYNQLARPCLVEHLLSYCTWFVSSMWVVARGDREADNTQHVDHLERRNA